MRVAVFLIEDFFVVDCDLYVCHTAGSAFLHSTQKKTSPSKLVFLFFVLLFVHDIRNASQSLCKPLYGVFACRVVILYPLRLIALYGAFPWL